MTNNFHRFYRAVYVGRVKALPTKDLYKALAGNLYATTDRNLTNALFELAHEELVSRGELGKRGLPGYGSSGADLSGKVMAN